MGRPFKKLNLSPEFWIWLEALRAAKKDPIPQDPERLRILIEALLWRITDMDTDMGRSLRGLIQDITAGERYRELRADYFRKFPFVLDMLKRDEMIQLGGVFSARIKRSLHVDVHIEIQRTLLLDYQEKNGYPKKVRNLLTRHEWLTKHSESIIDLLTNFTCNCTYENSLNGISFNSIKRWKSNEEFLLLILATLHNSTPLHIRKVLRQSSKTQNKIVLMNENLDEMESCMEQDRLSETESDSNPSPHNLPIF